MPYALAGFRFYQVPGSRFRVPGSVFHCFFPGYRLLATDYCRGVRPWSFRNVGRDFQRLLGE